MSFFQELKKKIQSFETNGRKKLLARRVFNSLIGGARPRLDAEYDWNPKYQALLDEAQKDRKPPTQSEIDAYFNQLVAENFKFKSNVSNQRLRTMQRKQEAKSLLIEKWKKEAIVNEDGTLKKCPASRDWGSTLDGMTNVTVYEGKQSTGSVWCSGTCLLCGDPNILVQNKPCNHAFCLECWRSYLLSGQLTCPLVGCSSQRVIIPDRLFVELVREKPKAEGETSDVRVLQDRKKAQRLYEKWHGVEEGRTSYPVLNDSDEMFSPPCPTCQFQTVIPRNHSQFLLCQQMTRRTGVRDPLVPQYINGNLNSAFAFNSKNNFGKCMTVFCIKPTCTRRMALQWVDPIFGCNALCDTRHSNYSKCIKCGQDYYDHPYSSDDSRHACRNGGIASFQVNCGPKCQKTHNTLCEKCGKSNKEEDIYYSTGERAHKSRPYRNAPESTRQYEHYCLFDKEGNLLQGTVQNPLPRGFFPTDPSKVTLGKKGYWINHGHFVEESTTASVHKAYEEKNPGIPMDGMGGSKYIWWTKLNKAGGDGFVLSNPKSEFKFDKFLEDKGDRTTSNITFVEEDCTNHARRFKDKSVYDLAYELYEFIIERGLPNKPNVDLRGKYIMPCPKCQSLKEYQRYCEHMKCGDEDYDQTPCKGNGIRYKERSSTETVTVDGAETTWGIYEGDVTIGTYTNFCRSCFQFWNGHESEDACRNYASARKIWGTLLLNADPEVRKRIPITGIEKLPKELVNAVLDDIDKVTTATSDRYGVVGRPGHKRTTQNERNAAKQNFKNYLKEKEQKETMDEFYTPCGKYSGEAFDPSTVMSLRSIRKTHGKSMGYFSKIPNGEGTLTILHDPEYSTTYMDVFQKNSSNLPYGVFGKDFQEELKQSFTSDDGEPRCIFEGDWEKHDRFSKFKKGKITLYRLLSNEEQLLQGSFDFDDSAEELIIDPKFKFSGIYKQEKIEINGVFVDEFDDSTGTLTLSNIHTLSNVREHPEEAKKRLQHIASREEDLYSDIYLEGNGLVVNHDDEFLGIHAYMGKFYITHTSFTYSIYENNNAGFIVKHVDNFGTIYITNPHKDESLSYDSEKKLEGKFAIRFIAHDKNMEMFTVGEWGNNQLLRANIKRTTLSKEGEIKEKGKYKKGDKNFSTLEEIIRHCVTVELPKVESPSTSNLVQPNSQVRTKKRKRVTGGAKKRKRQDSSVLKPLIFLNNESSVKTTPITKILRLNNSQVVNAKGSTLEVWDLTDMNNVTSRALNGHTASVRSVVKLNDTTIVSGSGDRTLRVWDLSDMNNATSRVLNGHTASVRSMTKLNETTIVSGSGDTTLRVWDLTDMTNDTSRVLRGHTDWVNSVVKLNETTIVSGSDDNTLRVWDLTDMNNVTSRVLNGHTNLVNSVVKLNETTIVSGSDDNTLRVWDLTDMNNVTSRVLNGHTNLVSSVIKLNETTIVSRSDDNTLRIWNLTDMDNVTSRVLRGHTNFIFSVIKLNETTIVSASWDRTLRIWDLTDMDNVTSRVLRGHTNPIRSVIKLNETTIVSGGNSLAVWQLKDMKRKKVKKKKERGLKGIERCHVEIRQKIVRTMQALGGYKISVENLPLTSTFRQYCDAILGLSLDFDNKKQPTSKAEKASSSNPPSDVIDLVDN